MFSSNGQVVLPLNLGISLPKNDPVFLLNSILEKLDYSALYKSYCRSWHKFDPKILFKILVYGYMTGNYSCRDIESACKRDICFMWLLNGCVAPDASTIARFQNIRLLPIIENLFYQFVQLLYEQNEISFKNIFVDGTKIEANANRYSFVWKSAIEKYISKLSIKEQAKLEDIKNKYGFNTNLSVVKCLEYLKQLVELQNIRFVNGKGKHKSQIQKDIEILTDIYEKSSEYSVYLEKIGNKRNSMSKTDEDATFMRMKEDHMRNGQLKPAYNIQIGVDSEYIVGIGSFADRSDARTLIPFLERIKKNTNKVYANVVADAGYESEENYIYLAENNQVSYIKPMNYEISKTRKYKTDIYRAENLLYIQDKDVFMCSEGKELKKVYTKESMSANGYILKHNIYRGEQCVHCPNKDKCYSNKKENKEIKVSINFLAQRKNSLSNITSEEGIVLRMNRSIQVEGAFGVIKQDMGFRRFLTRGKRKTETQFMLLALAYNIQKMYNKRRSGREKQELHPLKKTA